MKKHDTGNASPDCGLRRKLVDIAQRFNGSGLSVGTSGNASVRHPGGGFLITPSGTPYAGLTTRQLVHCEDSGAVRKPGDRKPSCEWRFHAGIYAARGDAEAIVHIHSPYATAIACSRESIPAFHYMVAVAGGKDIPCADYATFGSPELAKEIVRTLDGRRACLLANHGQVTIGASLEQAYALTTEVENLAQQYWLARQHGSPVVLDDEEMQRVLAKFEDYGANQGISD